MSREYKRKNKNYKLIAFYITSIYKHHNTYVATYFAVEL
jgi:hypothetical protein